jgi:hypothetical protein
MAENVASCSFCRYAVSVVVALGLYALALVLSIHWLHQDPGEPWKYFIAVLPVVPALWIPVAAIRYVRGMDELQKQIQLEALAFGFVSAAMLMLAYGFLQNAGLPEVSWIWVFPVMCICLMAGQLVARRRYQ